MTYRPPTPKDRQCGRKTKYGTEEAAQKKADQLNEGVFFEGQPQLQAYQCDECRRFHVGHGRGDGRG